MSQSNNKDIVKLINQQSLLKKSDIEYLTYKTENKDDFLILNYIQSKVISNNGDVFLESSEDKIEYIIELLLNDEVELIYNFYKETSRFYLKNKGNNIEHITPFNLLFITYMHIALKVIREYS